MKRLQLTEAEVKVALREYVERNKKVYNIDWAWGMMALYVDTDNENRVDKMTLVFEDER